MFGAYRGHPEVHPSPWSRSYAPGVAESTTDGLDPADEGPYRDRLRVGRSLRIPLDEVQWRATTSGGPGGQHANRANSRVEVRFDVLGSPSLGPRQRARLLERIGPVVRASAGEDRSQARNRQVARDRLAARLTEGLRTERPRRPTAPTRGSKERRLADKRSRADTKRGRSRPGPDD